MNVKEWREAEKQAYDYFRGLAAQASSEVVLRNFELTDHMTMTVVLSHRLKKSPDSVMKMDVRDQEFNDALDDLAREIQSVPINVSGNSPWSVKVRQNCNSKCRKKVCDVHICADCPLICKEHDTPGEVYCEVRNITWADAGKFGKGGRGYNPPNMVEVLTGRDCDDWDYGVYKSVDVVARNILASPLDFWNSQLKT